MAALVLALATFFSAFHQAAVADNVGGQDCGEAAFHGFLPEKGE